MSDANTKVVSCSDNNPTTKQSESTTSVMMHGDCGYLRDASKEHEALELQEDFVHSLVSGAGADSVSNFHKGYEHSSISVLDSTFLTPMLEQCSHHHRRKISDFSNLLKSSTIC